MKTLSITAVIAAAIVYVGGHLTYNEEEYSMTVTNPNGERYTIHDAGFHWVEWGVRTDRYKQETTVNFTRDSNTKSEDLDFKW